VQGTPDASIGLPSRIVDIMAAVLWTVAWNVQLWRGLRSLRRYPYVDLRAVPRMAPRTKIAHDAQAMALRHGSSWAAPMERVYAR